MSSLEFIWGGLDSLFLRLDLIGSMTHFEKEEKEQ